MAERQAINPRIMMARVGDMIACAVVAVGDQADGHSALSSPADPRHM
jgi:hypothetical protein